MARHDSHLNTSWCLKMFRRGALLWFAWQSQRCDTLADGICTFPVVVVHILQSANLGTGLKLIQSLSKARGKSGLDDLRCSGSNQFLLMMVGSLGYCWKSMFVHCWYFIEITGYCWDSSLLLEVHCWQFIVGVQYITVSGWFGQFFGLAKLLSWTAVRCVPTTLNDGWLANAKDRCSCPWSQSHPENPAECRRTPASHGSPRWKLSQLCRFFGSWDRLKPRGVSHTHTTWGVEKSIRISRNTMVLWFSTSNS